MPLLVLGGAAAGPTGAAAIEAIAPADASPRQFLDDDLLPVVSAAPQGHGVQPAGLEYTVGGALLRSYRAAVGTGSAVRWARRIIESAKSEGVTGLLLLEGIGAARRAHGAAPVAHTHAKSPALAVDAAVPALSAERRDDLLQASAMLRTLVSEADRVGLPLTCLFVFTSGSLPHDAMILAGALAHLLHVPAPAAPPAYWRTLTDAPPTNTTTTLFQ